MEAPERIYLQIQCECYMTLNNDKRIDLGRVPCDELCETTPCSERVYEDDVEYVRRDVAVRLREALRLTLFWGDDWTGWQDEPKEIQPRIAYADTAFLADSPEAAEENGESET